MTNVNGPFKDHLTRDIGANLRVCHFNIEGISRDKCEVLSKLMNDERVDVIALQETHTIDAKDLKRRKKRPKTRIYTRIFITRLNQLQTIWHCNVREGKLR